MTPHQSNEGLDGLCTTEPEQKQHIRAFQPDGTLNTVQNGRINGRFFGPGKLGEIIGGAIGKAKMNHFPAPYYGKVMNVVRSRVRHQVYHDQELNLEDVMEQLDFLNTSEDRIVREAIPSFYDGMKREKADAEAYDKKTADAIVPMFKKYATACLGIGIVAGVLAKNLEAGLVAAVVGAYTAVAIESKYKWLTNRIADVPRRVNGDTFDAKAYCRNVAAELHDLPEHNPGFYNSQPVSKMAENTTLSAGVDS
ncbi:MAG: hypothetical protein ABIE94_04485 [archaeon]